MTFAFAPNFAAITPQVVLAAVGQAFYATGVGAAMMLAYGSYVAAGTSLVRAALIITGSILLVSLFATLRSWPTSPLACWRGESMRKYVVGAILALALIGALFYLCGGSRAPPDQAPLRSLMRQSMAEIKEEFNTAKDNVLLLLSPT